MKRWNWVVVGLGALVVVMAGAVALYVDRVREPVADEQALRQAEEASRRPMAMQERISRPAEAGEIMTMRIWS